MIINGSPINEKHFYRIKNNFDKSENCFWYYLSSNEKELNSVCTNEKEAIVYIGKDIIKHVELIRKYKTAQLVQV